MRRLGLRLCLVLVLMLSLSASAGAQTATRSAGTSQDSEHSCGVCRLFLGLVQEFLNDYIELLPTEYRCRVLPRIPDSSGSSTVVVTVPTATAPAPAPAPMAILGSKSEAGNGSMVKKKPGAAKKGGGMDKQMEFDSPADMGAPGDAEGLIGPGTGPKEGAVPNP